MKPLAVGVVLPVHDEDQLLPAALDSLEGALRQLAEHPIPCHTVIVLDACSDGSELIARRWRDRVGPDAATVTAIEARNVGRARRIGAAMILEHFSAVPVERLWLATTDADSEVPPSWLTGQVDHYEAGAGLWTGRVAISDRSGRPPETVHRWRQAYAAEARPVHGASLGVAASTYLAAGGFPPLRTGEDRALHDAIVAIGARTGHGGAPVITSARRVGRAPLGFAHALSSADDEPAANAASG